jgi:hypothetical protein
LNHVEETNIVTKTPWLTRTRWEKTFLGRNMDILVKLTGKPEEHEEGLKEIWNSGSRVMQSCWESVEDISIRGWDLILFWLNSVDSSKANTTPFRLDKRTSTVDRFIIFQDSTDYRYVEIWQRYLCFCCRAMDDEKAYGVEFSDEQRVILWQLKVLVNGGIISEEDIDQKVFLCI